MKNNTLRSDKSRMHILVGLGYPMREKKMPAPMRVERNFWNCNVVVKKNVFNRYLKIHTPYSLQTKRTYR